MRTLRAVALMTIVGAVMEPRVFVMEPPAFVMEPRVFRPGDEQAPPVLETQTITGVQPNQLELSPRGAHIAAAVLRGSRVVMTYDGVEGPRFDTIVSLPQVNKVESEPAQVTSMMAQPTRVVFSPDGKRFMYVARAGQEFVVMADGKEVGRGPWVDDALAGLGFSPNGRHIYYALHKHGLNRDTWELIFDGKPEPVSNAAFGIKFSPDGEHHIYIQTINPLSGRPSSVLVIDGRPAGYPAPGQAVLWDERTAPLFTADGLHVFVQAQSTVPGASDVFADGKPFMRATAVRLYGLPVGAGVIGVVTQQPTPNSQPMNFVTAGSRRLPGSDCPGFTGITGVYLSADGKHFAVRCQLQPTQSWMMVDGKKGLDYQNVSNAVFTADGRAVYSAMSNGKFFVVVGDVESEGYSMILPPRDADLQKGDPPVVITGNRIGWIAGPNPGSNDTPVVVDGKSFLRRSAVGLEFSPDGSRYAVTFGFGQLSSLNVDGVDEKGTNVRSFLRPPVNVGARPDAFFRFSPDNKHIAHFGRSGAANTFGIFIDGKFLPVAGVSPSYLTFTPDSRHLVWLDTVQGAAAIFVDGINVGSVDQAGVAIPDSWDVGADGTVTWVCTTVSGDIKRIRIHPSAATSIDSMIAKAR